MPGPNGKSFARRQLGHAAPTRSTRKSAALSCVSGTFLLCSFVSCWGQSLTADENCTLRHARRLDVIHTCTDIYDAQSSGRGLLLTCLFFLSMKFPCYLRGWLDFLNQPLET